ncbi:MAG: PDZ domain-containing protein, partial [Bacteroidales bacterium]|nr:PDZ domain-containing protein [Bacteroidales bacterium]
MQEQQNNGMGKFLKLVAWGVVIVAAVNVFSTWNNAPKKELDVNSGNWTKLSLILQQIDKNYVDSIDHKDYIEKILPNIMSSLDPHSSYLPPVELEEADASLEGNFGGIGVQFNVPNDTATIINVVPGGPSEKVGILSGDKIIKVDGKVVAGVKIDQDYLVKSLKGEEGTIVKVEIKRDDVDDILSFSIERGKIPVKSIDVAMMMNDSLAYVKLSKFTKSSYKEFLESVVPLK